MKATPYALCSLLVLSICFTGCQRSDDPQGGSSVVAHEHDHHHEHPTNLLEGYQMLSDLYAVIAAAFQQSDPDAAHDQLHEVAHILDEDLPGLVENDAKLSDDQKSGLLTALASLFEEFSKLDDVLHGGPEVDFPDVNSKIESAMSDFKALIQ